MNELYDKDGSYIGWKKGKPFWSNHGKHSPERIKYNDEYVVICNVCQIELRDGEYDGEPEDKGRESLGRLIQVDRISHGVLN